MTRNGALVHTVRAEMALIDNPAGENGSSGPFKAGQWSALAGLIMSI